MSGDDRFVLVDASAFITLAGIGWAELLRQLDGQILMPAAVSEEITDDRAVTVLSRVCETWLHVEGVQSATWSNREIHDATERAASYLGVDSPRENWHGDVALLTYALGLTDQDSDIVVVTDDKPLRKACKALSIPLSVSIGVLVRAVERGELAEDEAKDALYAMDEVGARLSASLVRRAERLIEEAAAGRDD